MAERGEDLEDLLEATWAGRGRRFASRERRVEASLTTLFLLGAGLMLIALPGDWRPDPLLIALVFAYAAASLVVYPLGVGDIVPTQPLLVVMFAFAPAACVPLLIWLGLSIGRLFQAISGHRHSERLLLAGGDAVHALGPALLLVLLGFSDAREAPWPVWVAALGAQIILDGGSATVREWLVHRVRPKLQLPILGQVAALDAALMPLGLLAAASLDEFALAPVALLPLVGLLAFTARDRAERTSRLSARFHALERERRRLQVAVKRIGDAFASQLDMDALLEITTRAAVEALNADAGRASTLRPGDQRLIRRFTVGEDEAAAALLSHAERSALEATGLSGAANPDADAIAFSLRVRSAPSATIAIARQGAAFTDDERALFEYLCEQATVAAENVSRHEALHRQALTDELTGLANHRRLQELLAAATDRFKRTGTPAALVLLDLDNFKLVNDVHGHQIGDKVLRAVGRHLRSVCRTADEPARYGGEELAVVLSDTPLERATEFAERLRRGIASLELTGSQGEKLNVTVSIGVAVLGEETATSAALIAAADAALYAAKLNGRNRVEMGPHAREGRGPAGASSADRPLTVPRGGQHALAELALTLARAVDAKQSSTAGHSRTVAHLSAVIAEGIGLQPSHVYRIWLAGLVHDVGKIAVPDEILEKPEPLSAEEYDVIKTHSVGGQELLAGTALAEQAVWVRHHHERYDGAGYPDRLAAEAIPLESRIIHVADAFEAMLADRPYRRGIGREGAARELILHTGTQFDPQCVGVLLDELGLADLAADPRGAPARALVSEPA